MNDTFESEPFQLPTELQNVPQTTPCLISHMKTLMVFYH